MWSIIETDQPSPEHAGASIVLSRWVNKPVPTCVVTARVSNMDSRGHLIPVDAHLNKLCRYAFDRGFLLFCILLALILENGTTSPGCVGSSCKNTMIDTSGSQCHAKLVMARVNVVWRPLSGKVHHALHGDCPLLWYESYGGHQDYRALV
jgi:hypothetical protein